MTPSLPRAMLALCSAILAIYGAAFLFAPALLGDLVGLQFVSPNASVEVRSFYGGLELGMAAFLFVCAQQAPLVSPGLLFLSLAFGCAGAARLLGVLQYGCVGLSQPLVGLIELSMAGFAAWLRSSRRDAPRERIRSSS